VVLLVGFVPLLELLPLGSHHPSGAVERDVRESLLVQVPVSVRVGHVREVSFSQLHQSKGFGEGREGHGEEGHGVQDFHSTRLDAEKLEPSGDDLRLDPLLLVQVLKDEVSVKP
jgi:hypothetical protein